MTIDKITNAPTPNEHIAKTNELIDVVNQGGGGVTDVKVNDTSVVSGGVANIDLTGYAQKSGGIFSGNIYAPSLYQQSTSNPSQYVQSLTAETINTYSANRDLSNINSTSSANFDGQWVFKFLDLQVPNPKNGGSRSYDLSSYLPSDNYIYEVMFELSGVGAPSGKNVYLVLGTVQDPYDNAGNCFHLRVRTNPNGTIGINTGILPIDTNRTVYTQQVNKFSTNCSCYALGYRRVGTNS